jgi:thioredoxin reductase (NADPH)
MLAKDLITQGVEIMWNTELKEVKGDTKVRGAVLVNNKTGETTEIDVDGVFVQVGEAPNSQIAEEAGIEVDNADYVIVDNRQRTNIAGVFAAGDVTTGPVKQIGTAVGEAVVAANEAFGYIKRPYYYKA